MLEFFTTCVTSPTKMQTCTIFLIRIQLYLLLCRGMCQTQVRNLYNQYKTEYQEHYNTKIDIFQFDFPNQMHKSYDILQIQAIVEYNQNYFNPFLLTANKKLPTVLKKLIVPAKNIHSFKTRHPRASSCYSKASFKMQGLNRLE